MSFSFDYKPYLSQLIPLLLEIEQKPTLSSKDLARLVKKFPKPEGAVFSKDQLITSYRELAGTQGLQPYSIEFIKKIQMKPMRTQSGVATVTVLTKPFPCPGKCIFCPNDIRMPKSYLSDEPGAQRAERNYFDPYLQTYNRLQALNNIGHPTDKIEIIVLGGTWSYYPEPYQIWFIKRIFEALNNFGISDQRAEVITQYEAMEKGYHQLLEKKQTPDTYVPTNNPVENKEGLADKQVHGEDIEKTYNQVVSEVYVAPERQAGFDTYQSDTWASLFSQQKMNETAIQRCVGLVIETRPDNISQAEVIRIRKLGCTKAQIGVQSLQDSVLEKNKRGHDVAATRKAFGLLRQAGFKIHAHWMANLYGSDVELDKEDYLQLFLDPDFRPDELKVYPCSLIGSAELMQYYRDKKWRPYSYEELLSVVTFCLAHTPEYCRLTRVIRDIPSQDIEEGNKLTNFREIAEKELTRVGEISQDIRSREIKRQTFDPQQIYFKEVCYKTQVSQEHFLQYQVPDDLTAANYKRGAKNTPPDKLLSFLRLSIPSTPSFIHELTDCAIIREIHVYGVMASIGEHQDKKAQHLGLGTKLIEQAKKIAVTAGFKKLAVISSIGTREYYRNRGFSDSGLYQTIDLM